MKVSDMNNKILFILFISITSCYSMENNPNKNLIDAVKNNETKIKKFKNSKEPISLETCLNDCENANIENFIENEKESSSVNDIIKLLEEHIKIAKKKL